MTIADDLAQYLLADHYNPGSGWYRFPNGHEASVGVDRKPTYRFTVMVDPSLDPGSRGEIHEGLTTDEVEELLAKVFNLPQVLDAARTANR